jgi:hypothetical protein
LAAAGFGSACSASSARADIAAMVNLPVRLILIRVIFLSWEFMPTPSSPFKNVVAQSSFHHIEREHVKSLN